MGLTKEEARAIVSAIDGALGKVLEKITGGNVSTPAKANDSPGVQASSPRAVGAGQTGEVGIPLSKHPSTWGDTEFEKLYQAIKRRLIDECRVDPILLHLLTTSAPELKIDIEPSVIELEEKTLRGRIARLIGAGFFDQARTQAETGRELKRTGSEAHSGRLSEAFASLVNDDRALTREGDGYQKAPGVTVTERKLIA